MHRRGGDGANTQKHNKITPKDEKPPFLTLIRKMEELWKNLKPPFDDYSISNFGHIRNKRGKEIKPYAHQSSKNNADYVYPMVHINIRRKGQKMRMLSSLSGEVYKAFGDGDCPDGIVVYHRDGDKWNCRIDNLFVAKAYTTPPTQEQVEIYESQVIPCVKHIIKIRKFNDFADIIDVDNIIGESCLKIWIYLSQYKDGTSFYQFCKRYVEFAFLEEWKKKAKEREYVKNYLQNHGSVI